MINLAITGIAAAYLIWSGAVIKVNGGFIFQTWFKAVPLALGTFLAFGVYARFMGWPL